MRGIGRRLGRAAGIATAAALCVPLLAQSAQATGGSNTPPPDGPRQTAPYDGQATNPNRTAPEEGDAHQNIIGGSNTSVDEYPYIIAALREGGPRPMGQTCTGSVIGPKTILIAAHCKDGDGAKSFYYGADDLTQPEGGVKIDVESYTQHPNYESPNGWQTGWDVAVVQTVQEIPVPGGQYADFATSADDELTEPGNTGTAVGYGRVSDGENQYGHVKKAELPIVDGRNTCGSFGSFNDAYMVCAGYADGHDGICQGDSGGPLVVDGTVVGVASWVKTGCTSYGAWGRLTGEMGDWVKTQLPDPPEPGAPKAEFSAQCAESDTTCAFDASASSDEDGSIASYAWEFGDGKTGTGVSPSHTYAEPGSYQVKLTVTDNEGKTDSATRTVAAGVSGEPPSAAFTVSCWYEACDFDASGTRDPDGDIAGYAWEFGDGKSGSGATTSHSYPAGQQNYTAKLTVTDQGGNSDTASRQIQCWDFGGRAFCFSN